MPLYETINERIVDAMNAFSLADLADSSVHTVKKEPEIEVHADEKDAGSTLTPDQRTLKEEIEGMLGSADPETLEKIAEMLTASNADSLKKIADILKAKNT